MWATFRPPETHRAVLTPYGQGTLLRATLGPLAPGKHTLGFLSQFLICRIEIKKGRHRG